MNFKKKCHKIYFMTELKEMEEERERKKENRARLWRPSQVSIDLMSKC